MMQSTLGSYELQEEIGRGGMGIVYSAIQPSLGRRVAIKVLLPHLSEDSEFVERFLREARAAASLEHPGIVTIHDVGEIDGTYYFSMRFLEGQDLESTIQSTGALPVNSAADFAFQLGDALGYAHRTGIVHRDVKPANVLLENNGRAILTDFGIAWASSETRLTRTGSSIGSPDYMSPEQITGRNVDQRSDLYSLGVVFFQMLTGQLPFSGSTPIALAYQHVNEPIPSVREIRPEIPEPLDAIIHKLMAKEPDERYPSAAEFLTELAAVFPDLGARQRRASHPSLAGVTLDQVDMADGATQVFQGRRSIPVVGLALSIVGLVLLGGLFFYYQGKEGWFAASGEGGGSLSVVTPETPESPMLNSPPEVDPESPIGAMATALDEAVEPVAPDDPATVESEPPAVVTRALTITSLPVGATVILNGTPVEGVTPVEISVSGEEAQQVALRLEGYEPAGWAFTWDDLSAAQQSGGELHFPLQASTPPGQLDIRSAFEFVVRVAGRRHSFDPGTSSLTLPAGSHRLQIEAPGVFYVAEETVDIVSEGTHELALPPVHTVRVFAVPGNCRLWVDGTDVDELPIAALRLVAGPHELEFHWDSLGETRVWRGRVGRGTKQISMALSE